MTSAAYSFPVVSTSHTRVRIGPYFASAVTNEDMFSQDRPATVPASQLYYWARRWQEAEHEALDAIERGDTRRFGSGREAAEWLLADDD